VPCKCPASALASITTWDWRLFSTPLFGTPWTVFKTAHVISEKKILWNTPPWLGIEPGPRGKQIVRYIHSPTELSWPGSRREQSGINSFSHCMSYHDPGHWEDRQWGTLILPLSYHDPGHGEDRQWDTFILLLTDYCSLSMLYLTLLANWNVFAYDFEYISIVKFTQVVAIRSPFKNHWKYLSCHIYSETWITRTAEVYQKSLSYEKFGLWVMLSVCFNQSYELCSPYVATIASPLNSSVFHFLAKLSKICEIFFLCEKKTMKLSLLHKNVNTSSHIKRNLVALTQLSVHVMTKGSRYAQQIIITLAGTMKPGSWFELGEFASYLRSSLPSFTLYNMVRPKSCSDTHLTWSVIF